MIITTAFGVLARARQARALHPKGVTYTATITTFDDTFGIPGKYPGFVRLSRGVGLPKPSPEAFGFALRLLREDGSAQDLLTTTSSGRPLLRRLLFPRARSDGWYSSALPYEHQGRRVVLGARLVGRVAANVYTATTFGTWRLLAAVEIGNRVDDQSIRFNPWNTTAELAPIGLVNRVRRNAYIASQQNWP